MKTRLAQIFAVFGIICIAAYIFGPWSYTEKTTEALAPLTTSPARYVTQIIYDENDIHNPNRGTGVSATGTVNTTVQNTTQPSATNPAETNTSATAANDIPNDINGIINFYNNSLDKTTGLKKVGYTRNLTLCKAQIIGDKTNDQGVRNMVNVNNSDTAPSDLVKLDAAMVKSASGTSQGGKYVFVIELNDKTTNKNVKNGDGGYLGILGYDEVNSLVSTVAESALGIDGAKLSENYTCNMTKGKLQLTANPDGTVESVSFSGTQGGTGRVLIANVDLAVDLTSAYAVR